MTSGPLLPATLALFQGEVGASHFGIKVLGSNGTLVPMTKDSYVVERVQTGVRIEKRLLKVLKAFAEYNDLTLGDLLEGIVLHAFDGKRPFRAESLARIRDLKKFYGLDLDSSASHRLIEANQNRRSKKEKRA